MLLDLPAIRERAEKYLRDSEHSQNHITGCGVLKGRDCSCGWEALKVYVASLEARLRDVEAERDALRRAVPQPHSDNCATYSGRFQIAPFVFSEDDDD